MIRRTRGWGAAAPASYTGHDRRGSAAPKAELDRRSFVTGAIALLGFLVVLLVLNRSASLEQVIDVDTTNAMLGAATAALGTLLGVLLLLRHRLTGDAVALWTAVAVIVFATFGVGAAQLVPLLDTAALDTAVIAWVRPAGLLVTLALLSWALRAPDVDTRLRPGLLLGVALGAVMWVTFVLQLVPGLTHALFGHEPTLPTLEGVAVGPGLGVAWVVLAAAYLWRGLRHQRALKAWLGLMVYAFGLAELLNAAAIHYGHTWQVGAGALRIGGIAFGLLGVFRELQLSYAVQSGRLLEVQVDALTRQARMEAHLAKQAERAHEAHNALTAIEGATLTLERNRESLEPGLRATLAAAVTTEIARLQQLVSAERAAGTAGAFDLREVIDVQLALVRGRGGQALADLPGQLVAVGRAADTAEALQNLLLNARKHAPGSPVLVRAWRDGPRVVVRVEDRGPGVAEEDRERIFARGERAGEGEGDGLGLYVAGQLLREQGGELWLEESRPGGGAAFAFSLSAPSAPRQGDDLHGAGAGTAALGGDQGPPSRPARATPTPP